MNKFTPQVKKKVMDALAKVLDPELGLSIVELGLVYDVQEVNKKLKITMTLTTIGCPLFSLIKEKVLEELGPLGYNPEDLDIELTFDPPWSIERMSEDAKTSLGLGI